jgi:RNA recognition motif-containing protein
MNQTLIHYRKPDAPNSTEPHRGFGYVEFEDPEDTKEAIDNMDQSELFGKVIKVSAAKPPKNVNEGLGSKTALWEQVSSFSPFITFTFCS